MKEWNDTALRILDVAEELVKHRGFNAFSFKDLEKQVGIKTSSIHYYFETKADLASAVIQRFFARHKDSLKELDKLPLDASAKLRKVGQFFISNSENGEFCVGGMMSSDVSALSDEAKRHLASFFRQFESWVGGVIESGKVSGEFHAGVNSVESARIFVAVLEGGMLISRVKQSSDDYRGLLDHLIHQYSERK